MADANSDQGNSWWGWGLSIAQTVAATVQEKGSEILEVYKEDINEFTSIISSDAQTVIGAVNEALPQGENIVTQGLTSLTDGLSAVGEYAGQQITYLAGEETYEVVTTGISSLTDGINAVADLAEQKISYYTGDWNEKQQQPTLETDRTTFEKDPDDPLFQEWKKDFEWSKKNEEINLILGNHPAIMSIYQELVPEQMSPQDFWERYFFKTMKFKQQEEKKALILEKVQLLENESLSEWGDDLEEEQPTNTTKTEAPTEAVGGNTTTTQPETQVPENETNPETKPAEENPAEEPRSEAPAEQKEPVAEAQEATKPTQQKGPEDDDWLDWG